MTIKVGDKYQALNCAGELLHVIENDQGRLVARVNGSEFCIEGTTSNFEMFPKKRLKEEEYRTLLDEFWAKHEPDGTRVEMFN